MGRIRLVLNVPSLPLPGARQPRGKGAPHRADRDEVSPFLGHCLPRAAVQPRQTQRESCTRVQTKRSRSVMVELTPQWLPSMQNQSIAAFCASPGRIRSWCTYKLPSPVSSDSWARHHPREAVSRVFPMLFLSSLPACTSIVAPTATLDAAGSLRESHIGPTAAAGV